MVSEFISSSENFSGLNLLLIVAMLGWSVKTSSERFKTDSGILGFAKDSFSVAPGLDATFPLSSRKMSLRLSPLELLFGRSGFIFSKIDRNMILLRRRHWCKNLSLLFSLKL